MGPIVAIPALAASILRAPAVRLRPDSYVVRMATRTAVNLIRKANPEWWPTVEA